MTGSVIPSAALREVPLTFTPQLRHYLWGGCRLRELLGRNLPDGPTAESWEVSGHADSPSVVDRGPLSGTSLPELVERHGVDLVGRRGEAAVRRGVFPVLVKLLDATHPLSVQLHPDDAYARARLPGETGKTELWHVLHAEAGAQVICGLRPGVGRSGLVEALARGALRDVLDRVKVRRGDSIMVHAGTVHGILSGVVLVEIQQTSDTTYRIYDWDRVGADGRARELHIDRALEAINFDPVGSGLVAPRIVAEEAGVRREEVGRSEHFVVERVRASAGTEFQSSLVGETFEIWGVIEGAATLGAAAGGSSGSGRRRVELDRARFALLPATFGPFALRAATDMVALRCYLP